MQMNDNTIVGTSANDILRYGRIEILLQNYSDRYYLVYFSRKYYEIEMTAGELTEIKVSKVYPKYYQTLKESKFNLVTP